MARKLTVGRAPQGHPLRGGKPIATGGPNFAGGRGKAPYAGGGRKAGRAKPTTDPAGRVVTNIKKRG